MPRLGREKIYIGAEAKHGKTYAWMVIAKHLIPTGVKFVVIQSDDGVSKVAAELGVKIVNSDANGNVMPMPPNLSGPGLYVYPTFREWKEAYSYFDKIETWEAQRTLGNNDWVVVEGLDIIRTVTSGEFADRTAGLWDKPVDRKIAPSSWEAFINKRNDKRPILEGTDWNAIDTEIGKCLDYICYQARFNILATTGIEAAPEGQYGASKSATETQAWYAAMGMPVHFRGQRDYVRKFDTLILLGKSIGQGYTFQVFGDRGATMRNQNPNNRQVPPIMLHQDFYNDFLVKMAGWPMAESQPALVNNGASPVPPPPRLP